VAGVVVDDLGAVVACRVVAVGRRCFFGLGGGGFRLAGGCGGGAGVVAMMVVVSPVEVTSVVVARKRALPLSQLRTGNG
jgi:hypothetical protein